MEISGNAYEVTELESEVTELQQSWRKRGIRNKQLMCYYTACNLRSNGE